MDNESTLNSHLSTVDLSPEGSRRVSSSVTIAVQYVMKTLLDGIPGWSGFGVVSSLLPLVMMLVQPGSGRVASGQPLLLAVFSCSRC